ncbi:MAG TPA: hypothetical protein VME46_15870 [Acidimicrobiales bacterium]|nr:hypothetical protein [Acidimicrobiales bacterium]
MLRYVALLGSVDSTAWWSLAQFSGSPGVARRGVVLPPQPEAPSDCRERLKRQPDRRARSPPNSLIAAGTFGALSVSVAAFLSGPVSDSGEVSLFNGRPGMRRGRKRRGGQVVAATTSWCRRASRGRHAGTDVAAMGGEAAVPEPVDHEVSPRFGHDGGRNATRRRRGGVAVPGQTTAARR